MKFATKKVMALVLVIAMMAALAVGCGKKDDGMSGKYVLTSGEAMGITMDADALAAAGMEGFFLEFSGDGKLTGEVMGDTGEGTYEVDGNTVSITIDGETMDFEKDGDTLFVEMEQEGMTVKLNFEKE